MGCNCAANKQIEELYRHYGEKRRPSKSETVKVKIKKIIRNVGVGICMFFLVPLIVLYVFYKAFGDDEHKISVRKFFRIKGKAIGTNVG